MTDWDEGGFGAPPPGHNKPPPDKPAPFSDAESIIKAAQQGLTAIQTIRSQDQADKVAVFIRGVQGAFNALDAHRDARVRPLNARVASINDEYRPLKQTLQKIEEELKAMNRRWLTEQDKIRQVAADKAAEEARLKQEEAEKAQQKARDEAERAKDGDVTEGPLRQHEAALEASKLTLEARKAEAKATKLANSKVKSGGAKGVKSVGLTIREVLTIANKKDLIRCVTQIGLWHGLPEAVIEAAKSYRKRHGELPIGITRTEEKI